MAKTFFFDTQQDKYRTLNTGFNREDRVSTSLFFKLKNLIFERIILYLRAFSEATSHHTLREELNYVFC